MAGRATRYLSFAPRRFRRRAGAVVLAALAPVAAAVGDVRIEVPINLGPAFTDPAFAATEPLAVEHSPTSAEINAVVLTDEGATNGLRTVRCVRNSLSLGSVFNDWIGGKYSCTLSGNVLGNQFGLAERLVRRPSDGHYFTTVTGLNPSGTRFCSRRVRFNAAMSFVSGTCVFDDVSSISNSLAQVGNELCNASYVPSQAAVRVHCAPFNTTGDPVFTLKATVTGVVGPDTGRPHFRIAPFFHPPSGQDWILVFYTRSGTTFLDLSARRLSDGSLAAGAQVSPGQLSLTGLPAGGFLDVRIPPLSGPLSSVIPVLYGNGSAVDYTLLWHFAQPGASQVSGTWVPAGEVPAGATIVVSDITRYVGLDPTTVLRYSGDFSANFGIMDGAVYSSGADFAPRISSTAVALPLSSSSEGVVITVTPGLFVTLGAVDPHEISSEDFEVAGRIRLGFGF